MEGFTICLNFAIISLKLSKIIDMLKSQTIKPT